MDRQVSRDSRYSESPQPRAKPGKKRSRSSSSSEGEDKEAAAAPSREEERGKKEKKSGSYSPSPEAARPARAEPGEEGDSHRRVFVVKKDKGKKEEEEVVVRNGSDVKNAKAKSGSESEVSGCGWLGGAGRGFQL